MIGACLLGRLYGIETKDALFRIPIYHNSQNSIRLHRNARNMHISCPQLPKQLSMVQAVLSVSNRYFEGVIYYQNPQGFKRESKTLMPVNKNSFAV